MPIRLFALFFACLCLAPAFAAARPPAAGLPLEPTRKIAFSTDEGTWISLDVSPDGRTIVFDLLGDLYVVPIGGGPARAITHGLAFDSQPVFSPDGSSIAFVSDRSGAENVWVAGPDGSRPRQVTRNDGPNEFVSPAWSADGRSIFVSLYRSDRNAAELWRYDVIADGAGEKMPAASAPAAPLAKNAPAMMQELTGGKFSALGPAASRDGRYLYYAVDTGPLFEDDVTLPLWSIHRRDLVSGDEDTVVVNQGSAMRPVLSPDGRFLAYAVRRGGETELRLRELATGRDRSLAFPIQRDDQEALPTRDLVPGYAFTPDGRAVVISFGGRIQRVEMASGRIAPIPFKADVDLEVGPYIRLSLTSPTGPVKARLIQDPVQSPDGRRLVFSALGRLWHMDLPAGAPRPLLAGGPPQFEPAWSPDGRSIAYVTWTSRDYGQVWIAPAEGGAPRQVSATGAYYTSPVFSPDGRSLLAFRSSGYARDHTLQEPRFSGRSFGAVRQANLVELPLSGGDGRIIASGEMGGRPQFVDDDPAHVFVMLDKGLSRIALDGSERKSVLTVVGPGYYFLDHDVPVDDLEISPDGAWILAQNAQQLHLLKAPRRGQADTPIDLADPSVPHRKLTSVGADFFAWADHGRTITWAVGSTFWRRPLAGVPLDPPGPSAGKGERPAPGVHGVEAFAADVRTPRDVPKGRIILRGATAITMRGDEVIPNADVLIEGDRIVAIGARGSVPIPAGTAIRDLSGGFILPGFVDDHDHIADIRRGVLQLDDWALAATLAYGVTTSLDPSTLTIDMLAYQDLIDAGQTLGPRLYSTATAVFSLNRFTSEQEVGDVLSRYVDDYRTGNLKEYRTGDRQVREWVVDEARKLGLMPTTEGALDMKLDLTQVEDGFPGNEHSMSAVPLYRDVIQLFARARVSYTLTLQISHGGPPAGEHFIAATDPYDDPKIARLYPPFARTRLFTRVPWVAPDQENYARVAAGAAAVQRAGGLVGVGSHGNYPGIGFHWELQAMAAGGMTPREVLRAATMGSAEAIGRNGEIGSLAPGKFADLVILTKNPLADIDNTLSIRAVMKGGRLYDADTLAELWPDPHPAPTPWFAGETARGD
ncbi:MAG: amidohydrolase family protein [Caulobacteraceae bacterium]